MPQKPSTNTFTLHLIKHTQMCKIFFGSGLFFCYCSSHIITQNIHAFFKQTCLREFHPQQRIFSIVFFFWDIIHVFVVRVQCRHSNANTTKAPCSTNNSYGRRRSSRRRRREETTNQTQNKRIFFLGGILLDFFLSTSTNLYTRPNEPHAQHFDKNPKQENVIQCK